MQDVDPNWSAVEGPDEIEVRLLQDGGLEFGWVAPGVDMRYLATSAESAKQLYEVLRDFVEPRPIPRTLDEVRAFLNAS